MRRVLCHIGKFIFLSFMLLILSSAGSITAKASINYDKVVELELINKKFTEVGYDFYVKMDSNCKHLSNVRTSSKSLKAKIANHNKDYDTRSNMEAIQLFSKKKGTYELCFDIVDDDGKFLSTESATVIVCSTKDTYKGFKSIKLGRKNILKKCMKNAYTRQVVFINKEAPLTVKMKKGYKLLGMSLWRSVKTERHLRDGGTAYDLRYFSEEFENGSMLRLSEGYGFFSFNVQSRSKSVQYNNSLFAYTYVYLDYLDNRGIKRRNRIIFGSRTK
ncbi:MAG: hypothetical protein E7301_05085 [Butyrivibrio sp.]|nr:hypothetical protein [Butyrivibrio sp.]